MAKRLLVICTLLCLDLFVFVLIYESNVEDSVKASTTFYENVIALTFDDGPHGTYTKELLEGLKKREVVASFFILGAASSDEGGWTPDWKSYIFTCEAR